MNGPLFAAVGVNKPHLNFKHGVWACFTVGTFAIGCGRTPRDAWLEWRWKLRSLEMQIAMEAAV